MDRDLSDYELQKKLQATNKVFAKKMNASLRGSTDEFVPLIIPAINVGGRLFISHPIGAGEAEGGNFMDFVNKVKDIASIPFKIATMPLQLAKQVIMGSGEECETCEDGAGLFDFLKKEGRAAGDMLFQQGVKRGQQQIALSNPVAPAPVEGAGFLHDLMYPPPVPSKYGRGKGRKPRAKKGGADAGPVYAKVAKPLKLQSYESVLAHAVSPKVIDEPTHAVVKAPKSGVAKMPADSKPTLRASKGKGKPRAKKGGNLLSTLSDMASIMPSVFPTELDNWIPPEVTRGIAKKIAEKVSGGAKKAKVANPWLTHVALFKKQHPELKYKDVLILAKKTYHKAK